MKEVLQARVYEKTKDMTFPEFRAYLDDAFWQKLVNRKKNNNK